jgi:hypothetical protein
VEEFKDKVSYCAMVLCGVVVVVAAAAAAANFYFDIIL